MNKLTLGGALLPHHGAPILRHEVRGLARPRPRAPGSGPAPVSVPIAIAVLAAASHLLQLELEQDDGVLEQGAEHEDDAGDHPALDGSQTLSLGTLCIVFLSEREIIKF